MSADEICCMTIDELEHLFEKKVVIDVDSTTVGSTLPIRKYLLSASEWLGYSIQSKVDNEIPIILVHEDRHIPYLLLSRSCDSAPVAQFEFDEVGILLKVFATGGHGKKIEYAIIKIPWVFEDNDDYEKGLTELSAYCCDNIAVGVHAWESLLRTPDLRVHRTGVATEEAFVIKRLTRTIKSLRSRLDKCRHILSNLGPCILYVGHDCYHQAVEVNVALEFGIKVVVMPKGKPNHYYSEEDLPGSWQSEKATFYSHLSMWFREQLRRRWAEGNQPQNQVSARKRLETRVNDLGVLPYMNIDDHSHYGYAKFKEALDITDAREGALDSYDSVWVFAFHSFSDEACIWGLDGFLTLYSLFFTAASIIRRHFSSDCILLRPHPNYYKFFDTKSLESGDTENHTGKMDMLIQFDLCKEIMALGGDCFLSGPTKTKDVLDPPNSIVLTRHGNIVIEAAFLNRHVVFSRTAPFSQLFGETSSYNDVDTLKKALIATRNEMLSGREVKARDSDLLAFQHIFYSPHGKGPRTGSSLSPLVAKKEEPETLDEVSYGGESIEAVRERVRSAFWTKHEHDDISIVLGMKSNLP